MTQLTQAEIELILEVIADHKGRYEEDKCRCERSNQTGSKYHKRQVEMINTWAAIETKLSTIIQSAPRCVSCGDTENLTEVIATPDGTYHLCPEHLAEEDIA